MNKQTLLIVYTTLLVITAFSIVAIYEDMSKNNIDSHKAPTPLTIPQRVAMVQMNIYCPLNNNHPIFHDKEVCVYVPHLKEIIK